MIDISATNTPRPAPDEAIYRVVRNRCHIHNPPNRKMQQLIAQGWQSEHTILTIEAFAPGAEESFLGLRMNGGSCWHYSTLEEPAVITEWDRINLENWLEGVGSWHNDGLPDDAPYVAKFKECVAAAIAKLDAAPRPESPIVMRRRHVMHSAQAFAIVAPYEGPNDWKWILEAPYSVYLQRQKFGGGIAKPWNPREWLPTNNPVRFLGE